MKFIDILKVSLHNMWNNKTRTLLVTLVLFVLSALVTMIIAFSIDMMDVVRYQTNSSEDPLDLEIGYENWGMETENKYITAEEIEDYKTKIYEPNKNLFSSLVYQIDTMNTSINSVGDFGSGMYYNGEFSFVDIGTNPYEGKDALISGRLWNKDDLNKNYVWIAKQDAISKHIQVGDILTFSIDFRNENGMSIPSKNKTVNLEVKGILQEIKGPGWNNYSYTVGSEHINEWGLNVKKMRMESSMLVKPSVFEIMEIGDTAKQYNKFDYRDNQSGIRVSSFKAEDAKMTIYMTIGVVGGGLFLSLIVILLSIGCVSNSIQITVEQNRKFFGVMKAVGLRDNTVKKIVRYQAVIMIIIAVILAACVGVGVLAGVKPMILKALGVELTAVAFTLPAYVPFVVFAMLMILLLLFTRKSLNKISKMDVVSVISEVN